MAAEARTGAAKGEREGAGIRIAVVIGTTRPGNYTSKAAALVLDALAQEREVEVDLIDPARLELGFPGHPSSSARALQERIAAATGVVWATPEYHGSSSAMTKLLLENLGFPSVLAGKPVALLGVAAGAIGAIKALEQLRSVCAHIGAIVLPSPVSVAFVQEAFDEQGRCLDAAVEKRVRGVAASLLDYIRRSICPAITLERMVREGMR